ncbi:MAG TPA: hypothetical protein EYP85_09705 [Armatimonadetes bacterium]|nr:hypothetical protein [Armatimonadota bacterium]
MAFSFSSNRAMSRGNTASGGPKGSHWGRVHPGAAGGSGRSGRGNRLGGGPGGGPGGRIREVPGLGSLPLGGLGPKGKEGRNSRVNPPLTSRMRPPPFS